MKKNKFLFIAVVLALLGINRALAQDMLTRYEKAESFLPRNISKLTRNTFLNAHWISSASAFWYTKEQANGYHYLIYKEKDAKSYSAFDHQRIANLLKSIDSKERKDSLFFHHLSFSNDLETMNFELNSVHYLINLKSYSLSEVKESKVLAKNESQSPDKKWIVFVKDYNLFLKNSETGEQVQLTSDGKPKDDYATPYDNWSELQDVSKPENYDPEIDIQWSADSKYFIAEKRDRTKIGLMYLFQSTPKVGYRAKVWSYERALPGEDGIREKFYVFDVNKAQKAQIQLPEVDQRTIAFWPQFMNSSDSLFIGLYNRGYQSLSLYKASSETGKVNKLFTEQAKTMIETQLADCRWTKNYSQFFYTSEKNGWNSIYRYGRNGNLINQVTPDGFVVIKMKYIDEKHHQIYFTANGVNSKLSPYYRQLCRIDYDGKNLKVLTPEDAYHQIEMAPDKRYFVDNYSRINSVPVSVVRRLKDGKIISEPIHADIHALLASGWRFPEPFKTLARDGKTPIYGCIFYPSDFDSTKHYPIIDGTYSGPQAVRTPQTFTSAYRSYDVSFAELGFIVINVDGLGSALRSKKFHDFSYENLGDIGSLDHIAAIKQLAEERAYMDTSRVGIYGHSAGGYDAARAMLIHPEFYKVGISSAGNHDHRIAKAWWPEQYMGPLGPQYDEQSNFKLAKNLRGKLLLIQGDMDNNVNPASTLRMAGEFISNNRDVDMLIVPNVNHGTIFNIPYFLRKRWDYFVQYLKGVNPPHNYRIKSYYN